MFAYYNSCRKQKPLSQGGFSVKEYQFPVIIKYDPEEDIYLADCPLLQGCYTDGKTYEEALENIKDAIQLCIESRLAVGDPIPTPELVKVAV